MHTPTELILALKQTTGAKAFVETGTYLGDTCAWALEHFEVVHSIELSPVHHTNALRRFAGRTGLWLHRGRSEAVLDGVLPAAGSPAIFWLDAHWSGPGTDGEESECPLVAEIDALARHTGEWIVLVDDAGHFFAPPPAPHKADHWPLLPEVFDALRRAVAGAVIMILDNAIVCVPPRYGPALHAWCKTRRIASSVQGASHSN